jgi:ferredoxin
MADKTLKVPNNAPGAYYVDETCIDCDLCRNIAPTVFGRDDALGLSVIQRQPMTDDERALAEEARVSCPEDSIGNDGQQ